MTCYEGRHRHKQRALEEKEKRLWDINGKTGKEEFASSHSRNPVARDPSKKATVHGMLKQPWRA